MIRRALRPFGPANLTANGDGHCPTWSTGEDVILAWTMTSEARSDSDPTVSLSSRADAAVIEIWDGENFKGTVTTSPAGPYTLTHAALVGFLGSEKTFTVRAYLALGGGDADAHDQQQREARGRGQGHLVPAGVFLKMVDRTRLHCRHRLVVEVMSDVRRQGARRLVAARAVLVHRLQHDPVQFAPDQLAQPRRLDRAASRHRRQLVVGECGQPLRRPWRLELPDAAPDFLIPAAADGGLVTQVKLAPDVKAKLDVAVLLDAFVLCAEGLERDGITGYAAQVFSRVHDAEVAPIGSRMAALRGLTRLDPAQAAVAIAAHLRGPDASSQPATPGPPPTSRCYRHGCLVPNLSPSG